MAPRTVAVNAVNLAPGGGLSFLCNQAREFERDRPDWSFTYFVAPRSERQLLSVVDRERVVVPFARPPNYLQRVHWEQVVLPRLLRREGIAALYSPGGFAVFRSPRPQLVVDHNAYHHATRREGVAGMLLARARAERAVARASARRAEAVVYLSHSFAQSMRSVGFPEPAAVIPSATSNDWPEAARTAASVLGCEHCASVPFALGVHNRLPHKRLEWLAQAWTDDPSLSPRHLVLVGGAVGRRELGVERSLRSIVDKAPHGLRVHLVGALPRAEIAAFYRGAGLYLSASSLESFGLTPLEAMSFGVPCVLSDIAVHKEVGGDAAVYFRTGETASLTRAIADAETSREALSERGRVVASASWRTNVELFYDVFRSLCE